MRNCQSNPFRYLEHLNFRWQNIQNEFVRVEKEVASAKEFRGYDEFAVVYQPWSTKVSVIKQNQT